MITKLLSLLTCVAFTISAAFATPTTSPKAEMQKTIDDIIVVAGALPGDAQNSNRARRQFVCTLRAVTASYPVKQTHLPLFALVCGESSNCTTIEKAKGAWLAALPRADGHWERR